MLTMSVSRESMNEKEHATRPALLGGAPGVPVPAAPREGRGDAEDPGGRSRHRHRHKPQ